MAEESRELMRQALEEVCYILFTNDILAELKPFYLELKSIVKTNFRVEGK